MLLLILLLMTQAIASENIPYTTLENLYGDENLVLDEFFPGNSYINFGYCPNPCDPSHLISVEERVATQAALYDYAFEKLELQPTDHVLEVGCGRGEGCVRLKSHFRVATVKGVDLIPQQISRAALKHQNFVQKEPNLSFHVGPAESLPFPSASFTKIYSVEAAQHFRSLREFAKECARTLQPKGRVLVTTFFAVDSSTLPAMKAMMPINVGSVDNVKPLEEALTAFQQAGFSRLKCEKIGSSVFPIFDQWLAQQKTQDWGRLWAKAWREGLLEYYVLVFEKN